MSNTVNLELPDRVFIERVRLVQPSDCSQDEGEQSLDIEMVNNGTAYFARIKTKCWSSDGEKEMDQLSKVIKQLQDRADEAWNEERK